MLQIWIARLIALRITRAKGDSTPVEGDVAANLVDRSARMFPGGLRWVAWAIHLAAHRGGLDRAPVRWWTYILRTLCHWRDGMGIAPDGWPPDPPAASPPVRSGASGSEPESSPDRSELVATIAALEGLRRLRPDQSVQLDKAREELAALDLAGTDGGTPP